MERRHDRKAINTVNCPFCDTPCRLPDKVAPSNNPSVRCGRCLQLFTLNYARDRRRHLKRSLARLTSRAAVWLLALAVIAAASWWFHENHRWLRDHAGIRPYLDAVCDRLGCQLPPRQGPPLFQVYQLRQLDDGSGQPIIDFIVENRSGFRQRFPALCLIVEDSAGRRVMGQTFSPNDYLPEDRRAAAGRAANWMPPEQPMRVQLQPGAGMTRAARVTPDAAYRLEVP